MDNMKNNGIKWSLALIIVLAIVTIFGLQAFKSEAATNGYLGYDATYGTIVTTGGQAKFNNDGNVGSYGFIITNSTSKVGLGTTAPLSLLSVGGAGTSTAKVYGYGSTYGVYGSGAIGVYSYGTGTYGAYGLGTNYGLYSSVTLASSIGVYGQGGGIGAYGLTKTIGTNIGAYGEGYYGAYGKGNYYSVYGSSTIGSGYGGRFIGATGLYANGAAVGLNAYGHNIGIVTNGCSTCSVLAEMVKVSETPDNGDIMCLNPDNGSVEVCRTDKNSHLKGIAQKYAESIMRMGCSKAIDSPDGENFLHLGIMDVDAWKQKPECQGWYPIALSGLSEQTNVVCHTPQGKPLRYGDILVSSNIPGHLRPLDKGEKANLYQVAGRAETICASGQDTGSIMVWIQ